MKNAFKSLQKATKNISEKQLKDLMLFHLKYTRGKDWRSAAPYDLFFSFSMAVRDLAVDRFINTQRGYLDNDVKRLYYLSMEFLIGKLLQSNLLALNITQLARDVLGSLDIDMEDLLEQDVEAGLGNGGLGRLAACYMDSLASMEMPAYGYGLRYEHGIFRQEIYNGWQQENPDDWLKLAYPWEMARPEYTLPVTVYGRVQNMRTSSKVEEPVWTDWQMFEGIPYDIPVIGYGVNNTNMLRLWSSRDSKGFRLDVFNKGEYVAAVEEQNWAETVTKVLYPSDATHAGKELRLIQEYFLVTCSVRDILRRYQKKHTEWEAFADKNAIQLNDTHPALTVAELMRCFVDECRLPWDKAWELTTGACAYTNHTLLPEALERWPLDLMQKVLPRHMQLIFEINHKFLQRVELNHPGDVQRLRDVSIIQEGEPKQVRMAHLAVVGSHAVNGVSALHSDLLREKTMRKFAEIWPDKFTNVTNGITHRRWLMQANPDLADLITEAIGKDWIRDLEQLKQLEPLASDTAFQDRFMAIKRANKKKLTNYVFENLGQALNPDSMFIIQVKRLHMYKRQLLNALHIMHLYRRIKADPNIEMPMRTFVFAAKAAPSYHIAKRVIKLINCLADVVNQDADVAGRIKVVFIPDYNVSRAEIIIPAADVSEQISTAGMEASGTGNMKLALNGALTVGAWDGANIEIAQQVGEDNIFIFGHRENELQELRQSGYDPWTRYHEDAELKAVLDALASDGFFPDEEPELFKELFDELMKQGDPFFYLADFRPYIECHERVARAFTDRRSWAEKAILNVARMGWFSSDRSIREYAERIWNIERLPAPIDDNVYPVDDEDD